MSRSGLLSIYSAVFFTFAIPRALPAQVVVEPASDTAAVAPRVVEDDSLKLSARSALLRSLVLPGWGQAYVGAPGRGAIYFGIEAGSLWMVLKSRRELASARVLEAALADPDAVNEPPELPLARARRQQVEDWITLSVFFLFFSGADAYVAAQLSDFSQHVGVLPGEDGSLRVEFSVPLGQFR
jgi:hypothetical protein